MSRVFVVDANRDARLLSKQHKAAVLRRFPFTLILKDGKSHAETIPLRLKLDPGSKTTGVAVLDEARGEIVWAAELSHRGHQFGTLSGFELREYVLLKWNHACAYCGATNVPLELDHVNPRSRGGSHRESNRVPACGACNQRKGQQPVEEFLRGKPEVLCRIQASLKAPLGDTAALNGVRWESYKRVQATGSFTIATRTGTVQGIPARDVTAIQHDDGYSYMQNRVAPPTGARMGGGSAPDGI